MTDFKSYFEYRTGRPYRGEAGTHMTVHIRAVMDAMAEYVDAKIAGLQADADRYRWLRDDNAYAPEEACVHGGDDLDELCDYGITLGRGSAS